MYNQFPPSPMNMMNGRRSPLSGIPGSTPPMMVHQRLGEGRNSPLADMTGITPPGRSGMVPQRLREGHNSPLTADMMGMTPPRQNNMSPIMMGNNRQSPLGFYLTAYHGMLNMWDDSIICMFIDRILVISHIIFT